MNPFELRVPASEGLPLVYDSPHSGRYYPEDFRFKPPLRLMRRGEDAYVDELIADASARGVTVLLANYPRVYVDANREHDDIDESLLAEPWPGTLRPTGKSRRGLGLIRRDIVPGVEVHAEKLTVAEVKRRLDNVYWPYHRALRAELDRAKTRYGFVWHIDWHSMKSVGNRMTPDGARRRADFVIGDLDGASAERELVEFIVGSLRDFGYRVVLNDPYRGAAIVRRSAAPERGFHSVQIEINRALYLDEAAVELNAGFEKLRADIEAFTMRLVEAARARVC
ncbi:MAG TPA: N-formylglutamate amidohydrolase [Alphaproteobacteria bacterium]|nr:N-formylglutamate amidohydrolase [Alphaproteobacteria bacterium]